MLARRLYRVGQLELVDCADEVMEGFSVGLHGAVGLALHLAGLSCSLRSATSTPACTAFRGLVILLGCLLVPDDSHKDWSSFRGRGQHHERRFRFVSADRRSRVSLGAVSYLATDVTERMTP